MTSLGYSQYYEDVYTVGNSIIVPSYSAYGSNVYLAGNSETYYNGDGNTGYLRGSSISVTRQGSDMMLQPIDIAIAEHIVKYRT